MTSSRVMILRLKIGLGGGACSIFSSFGGGGGCGGISRLVLCPMVMKKSLRASAMAWGSVCVFFS